MRTFLKQLFYQEQKESDKIFLLSVIFLIGVGLIMFFSASLSVLVRSESLFYRILFNQLVLGLVMGGGFLYLFSRIPSAWWRRASLVILCISGLATLLVWIPGLGVEYGGARRWLDLGFLSFQPAELLKLGVVLYASAWISSHYKTIHERGSGLVPFLIFSGAISFLLLIQPDTGTLITILGTLTVMYFVSGAPWKHIGILFLIACIGAGALVVARPYILERVRTFINASHDPLGASYQITQSYIAVGSGQISGRGFGQSIQKFNYLPEPLGDSIFAVAAEEFGFIGSVIIIMLYIFFTLRGMMIASHTKDVFARFVVIGIICMIIIQAFLNIMSSLGLFPFTGLPLPLMSHGGTALLVTLASLGIVLGISREQGTVGPVRNRMKRV
jgi:cell division protein FtsW